MLALLMLAQRPMKVTLSLSIASIYVAGGTVHDSRRID